MFRNTAPESTGARATSGWRGARLRRARAAADQGGVDESLRQARIKEAKTRAQAVSDASKDDDAKTRVAATGSAK